jgi:hypothetical protein
LDDVKVDSPSATKKKIKTSDATTSTKSSFSKLIQQVSGAKNNVLTDENNNVVKVQKKVDNIPRKNDMEQDKASVAMKDTVVTRKISKYTELVLN